MRWFCWDSAAVHLDHLGGVHRSAGDQNAARWAWAQAVRTFDDFGRPGAEQIRAKLGGLDRPPLAAASGAIEV
jgi:hypothetical protein